MSDHVGLIELILVFAIVMGLGIYELRSVRRDTRRAAEDQARRKGETPPER